MTASTLSAEQLTSAQHHWLEHLRRQQHSGLSMAAYARQQGLAISTLYTMQRRLRSLMSAEALPQRDLFQAVTLIQDPPSTRGLLMLSFDLPGELHCSVHADVATGAALLQALARQPS